jgi:hypothetical protein
MGAAMSPLLRLLNLILPLLQPLAGALAPVFGIGVSNAEMTRLSETPVVPAGYAFGIWGPLFLTAIVYGVWQALPAQRGSAALARVRAPLALAFALNIAWMLASQLLGNGWHLVAILAAIVAAMVAALLALHRASAAAPPRGAERWLLRPLVGVLAGWASAAAFANLSITARWAGFGWFGLTEAGAAILVILAAAGFGAAVLGAAGGDPWYAGGLGWALVAIVVANLGARGDHPAVAGVAALGLGAVAAVAVLARRRRRRPRSAPAAAQPA